MPINMKIEDVPTRDQHRRKAVDVLDRIKARFTWGYAISEPAFADQMAKEWARERHDARVAACWALCRDLGAKYWPKVADPSATNADRILAARAVAILALIGQGGQADLGGTDAKSQLPLVNHDVFRWQSGAGKAWTAALFEVASRGALIIRLTGPEIVVSAPEGDMTIWDADTGPALALEVRAALRRAVLGDGSLVTGETAPIRWEAVPDDIDLHALRVALAMRILPPEP